MECKRLVAAKTVRCQQVKDEKETKTRGRRVMCSP